MKAASVLADKQVVVQSKKPMLMAGLKYGAAGGGLAIVLFVVLWTIKENPLDAGRLFDFFMLPLFIFFTLKELRDYRQGGRLAYWQGMTAGLFCYTTLALISALFIFIFLTYGGTDLLVQHQQENLAVLTDDPQTWIEQVGQQAYDKALKEIRELTALDLALDDFLKKALIGLFFTGIITLFFKK
ncbi:MAG: DUF4199 domain-containing protein [Bacteroidetes bacterium]|nr:DUF4199 domain-containing protein [Bacteroidota bacterium]